MKQNKQQYTKTRNQARWLSTIFVLSAFLYVIYQSIQTTNIQSVKVFYAIVFLAFGSIYLLAALLRNHYEAAIVALAMEDNINDAKRHMHFVQRFDVFRSYRNSTIVFQTLLLVDEHKMEELQNFLAENRILFESSIDLQLICAYNQFMIARAKNDKHNLNTQYQTIKELSNLASKHKKIAPVYSWELIDAMYYVSLCDLKRASNAWRQVNTAHMNNRELAHCYLVQVELAALDQKPEKVQLYLAKAKEMAPNMPAVIRMRGIYEK